MFENITYFFKRIVKQEQKELGSKDAAKERLHLVLMQDRANVSADFLELMKQEIIDVIKKYIVVDESSIDVRLTNKSNDDGTTGAPALYANIPIVNIKNDMMAEKEKKFEGVDFNKEMGIIEFSEEELQEKLNPVDSVEIEPIPGQEVEENKTAIIENYVEENEQNEEFISDDEDDEDDDVTFDDLLKAAEEEERVNKENEEKAEMIESNEINNQTDQENNEDLKEKLEDTIETLDENQTKDIVEETELEKNDDKNQKIEENKKDKKEPRRKRK